MTEQTTAADHLDEGGAPAPIPDPETAKIADLTAHCRETKTWPEGWGKMKAAEKRREFRRLFCPEASETFDPDDRIHLIAERIENMPKDELEPAVARLTDVVGTNYFELGGVFARISQEGFYAEWGFETFKDWVEAKTDMKRVKAQYLSRIYVKFVELEIPWSKFQDIGWTKAQVLLDVINQENADEWIGKAKVLSVRALREEVKQVLGASSSGTEGSEAGEGSESTASTKKLIFNLFPDQLEAVEAALGKMAEDANKPDNRNVCLEWICAAYLAGQFGAADAVGQTSDPAAFETLDVGQNLIGRMFEKVRELADTDYVAMEPIIKEIDRVFPNVTIEAKADG